MLQMKEISKQDNKILPCLRYYQLAFLLYLQFVCILWRKKRYKLDQLIAWGKFLIEFLGRDFILYPEANIGKVCPVKPVRGVSTSFHIHIGKYTVRLWHTQGLYNKHRLSSTGWACLTVLCAWSHRVLTLSPSPSSTRIYTVCVYNYIYIFRFSPKIPAIHGWSWNFFLPISKSLGVSGVRDGLRLKMWRKPKSLHPISHSSLFLATQCSILETF